MKGFNEHFLNEEYSEKFMDHVRQVCTFAKLIPGFKWLDRDDQVTLLKLCIFEVLFVRMSGLFQNEVLMSLKYCRIYDLWPKIWVWNIRPSHEKSYLYPNFFKDQPEYFRPLNESVKDVINLIFFHRTFSA
jgi:hypothetical protein